MAGALSPSQEDYSPSQEDYSPSQEDYSPSQEDYRQMRIKLDESFKKQRPEIKTVLEEVISTPIVNKSTFQMQKKNVKTIQGKLRLLFRAITALAGMLSLAYLLRNLKKTYSSLDDGSSVVLAEEDKNGQFYVIKNKIPEFCKNSDSCLEVFESSLFELGKHV